MAKTSSEQMALTTVSNCLDIKGDGGLVQASEAVRVCANVYNNLSCVVADRVETLVGGV